MTDDLAASAIGCLRIGLFMIGDLGAMGLLFARVFGCYGKKLVAVLLPAQSYSEDPLGVYLCGCCCPKRT